MFAIRVMHWLAYQIKRKEFVVLDSLWCAYCIFFLEATGLSRSSFRLKYLYSHRDAHVSNDITEGIQFMQNELLSWGNLVTYSSSCFLCTHRSDKVLPNYAMAWEPTWLPVSPKLLCPPRRSTSFTTTWHGFVFRQYSYVSCKAMSGLSQKQLAIPFNSPSNRLLMTSLSLTALKLHSRFHAMFMTRLDESTSMILWTNILWREYLLQPQSVHQEPFQALDLWL